MKKSHVHSFVLAGFSLALLAAVIGMSGCSGSNDSTPVPAPSIPTGTVNTFISDPPTCSTIYTHIYVTIAKVEANQNADAGPNDAGWQTLVDLSGNPKQVDLLSLNPSATQNFCSTLSMLGKESTPGRKVSGDHSGPAGQQCISNRCG